MPQSYFSHARETIRAASESRQECPDFMRRAQAELTETSAATRKAIIESREVMAQADAILARR